MPPAYPRARAFRPCEIQTAAGPRPSFARMLKRNFARFALAGLALDLVVGTALVFTVQRSLHAQTSSASVAHVRVHKLGAHALARKTTHLAKAAPAPIDREGALSPSALMARWQPMIKKAAHRFGVPEDWIREVMREESGGRTMLNGQPITSRAGALGLMQLLPATYRDMRARYGLGADILNPRDNILAGAAYLRELNKQYGYPVMFAAYNAGPQQVGDDLSQGHAFPLETRNYLGTLNRRLDPNGSWFAPKEQPEDATLTEEGKKAARLAALPASGTDAKSGAYLPTLPTSTLNEDGLEAAKLASLPSK